MHCRHLGHESAGILFGSRRGLGPIAAVEGTAHGHAGTVKLRADSQRRNAADDQKSSRPQKKPSQPPAMRWLRRL